MKRALSKDPPRGESEKRKLGRQLRRRLLDGVKVYRRKPKESPALPIEPAVKATSHCDEDLADQKAYLKWLSDKVKDVDIFRLKHLTGGDPFPIDQIYTPLRVNPRDLRPGVHPSDRYKDDEIRELREVQKETRELGEVLRKLFELEQYRCMIVLGRPGAGKTTLLKYLGYFYANRRQVEIEDSLTSRMPFFLRLKDIAQHVQRARDEQDKRASRPSLGAVIKAGLDENRCELPLEPAQLESWLADNALVLFDGLDEVADQTQREQVGGWLRDTVEGHKQTVFIITSRFHGFAPQYAPRYSFPVEVDDFDETQRRRFLYLWFGHVHRQRKDDSHSPKWEPDQIAAELDQVIAGNPHLNDLARNPLLLSMIALVRLDYLENIPDADIKTLEDRNELYRHCVTLFVNQWREMREWDNLRGISVSKPESKLLLGLLEQAALTLQKDQSSTVEEPAQISTDRLVGCLSASTERLSADTIKSCLRYSHERTLLLVEQKLGSWGFQHKTFQEYLCAEGIAHHAKSELETLVDHLGEDHWRVVFDLFVEGQTQAGGEPEAVLEDFLRLAGQRFGEDFDLAGRGWYWLEDLYRNDDFRYPKPERNRLQHDAWQGLAMTGNPLALAKFHDFAGRGLPAVGLNEGRIIQRLDEVGSDTRRLVHHLLLLPELFPQPVQALVQRLEDYLTDAWPEPVSAAAALALKRLDYGEPGVLDRHLFAPIEKGEFYRGSREGEQDVLEWEIDGDRYWLDAFEIGQCLGVVCRLV